MAGRHYGCGIRTGDSSSGSVVVSVLVGGRRSDVVVLVTERLRVNMLPVTVYGYRSVYQSNSMP
ncbi:hypothetical protein EYF80_016060 [Liparis tanakae]|uniref:Uncharacterized protein n=1 Tax=Liparis tanakae TaxID=230148 RepID=A0A4Z2I771_9TELE|nr:hypothetical protein EYF80_016060 [Liparis tanakae]